MPRETMFVTLEEGHIAHVIGEDEHTECGLPIPPLEQWTTDEPTRVCAKCRKAQDADEA